ncbi:hypothetical protein PG997_010371 [Apiospora hydei]|uniref:Uncharacterized protein n=1 Tax=Apiospora hydei TaxID=1337664 RepID=A0ABR1W0S4_9PEZI
MELYTVVFEFLTEIFTQWSKSSWKRFVKSFDEQAFNGLFAEKRKRIKSIENRMRQHADGAHMQADLAFQRDTGQRLSEMQLQVQTLTQVIQKLGIDVQSVFESKFKQIPYRSADDPLDRLSEPPLVDWAVSSVAEDRVPAEPIPKDTAIPTNQITDNKATGANCCTVSDVLGLLEPIAEQYNKRMQELVGLTSTALKVAVDIQIKRHLNSWTSSLASNGIWIQGPHNVPYPNQNMLTAACLVGLANNAKIPCISYFGSLQSRDSRGIYPSPPKILLNMIKSFIVQLLLLQEDPDMKFNFALSDVEQLMGPMSNDVDATLNLLHVLRALVPPYLLCVINSVQVLEDRSDEAHTQSLRKVLRAVINLGQPQPPLPGEAEGAAKTVKVCFTSDGHTDVLAAAVEAGLAEKVAYDTEDDSGEGEKLGSLWDDEAGSDG